MNTNFYNKPLLLILAIITLGSCVKTDDFELPKSDLPEDFIEENVTSISAVKGHYNISTDEIYTFRDTQILMEGYVISSDEGGNFYKKLVLQDRPANPTSGIQILIDDASLSDTYDFGRKVYVKLDGLSLWFNNGVLQLGKQNRGDVVAIPQALIDEHLIRTTETGDIEPLKIEIENFNENYKNLYIRLDNVQFNRNLVRDDHRFSFSSEIIDRYDGERQLESCKSGATVNLSTSTFSDFRALLLPQFSGSIEGVLTRNFYNDYYILAINTPEALNFEETDRCDPVFLNCGENIISGPEILFQESFETITTLRMLETRGWTNLNVSGGSVVFKPGTLGGNRHLRISAYSTQENPLEAWLITPAINLNKNSDEVLSFDLRASFDNATILRVYITTAYTGNPLTTNWTLTDAEIPMGPSNQTGTSLKRSNIDISCLEGNLHVAFRYLGSGSEKTTTYDVDNVRVTGN